MSETTHHDDHHDDPWSHVPPPSYWPVLVCAALCVLPYAFIGAIGGFDNVFDVLESGDAGIIESILYPIYGLFAQIPLTLLLISSGLFIFTIMGWGHQIIKEKSLSHDLDQQQKDLKMFTWLFFVSEGMAFGSIFGYLYIRGLLDSGFAAPEDIHLGGPLAAIATLLLICSSVTCEFSHHALMHGKKMQARLLLLGTIILGTIFLAFQGYEYGHLIAAQFTPKAYGESPYNAFSALFYISTGFHGVHVATGLLMLFVVWLRMEFGHFTKKRHFSFVAASWYWHFVDIIWILLFASVYVLLAG